MDKSGNMGAKEKIEALNIIIKDFINSIKVKDNKAEIHVSVFSFGGEVAMCDIPLAPIREVDIPIFQV